MGLSLAGSASAHASTESEIQNPKSEIGSKLRYFGDYELLEEIARGGMGVVYRARQVSLNRIVAVKMLLFGKFSSDEFVKRFQTEAQAVASLQHPNIVAIHEVGEHEGQHYFSMDYVAGQSLAERARDNPLPVELAADYVKTMAEAIHYAHQHGVLHRDLKPSNVLIDELDRPRITDFGLAKQLQADTELTPTGQVLGSPNYMPPEQADATRGAVGTSGDVYSLGAILYHLITGRPPFLSETLEDTLRQLLSSEPIAPRLLNPAVPRDLETICLKCLEKEPSRRYGSGQELAKDLDRWRLGEPILARPSTRWERALKWTKRKPAVAALSGLLLLSLVLGVTAVVWQWRKAVAAYEEANRRAQAEIRARERADQALLALLEIQQVEQFFAVGEDSWALASLARALRRNPNNGAAAARVLSALTQLAVANTNRLSKPLEPEPTGVSYQLSADGQRCEMVSFDNAARSWRRLDFPLPVPSWLPQLTEAIAEQRFNEQNTVEPVPRAQLQALRQRLSESPALDVWTRWAHWFFADSTARTPLPFSVLAAPDYTWPRIEGDVLQSKPNP